MDSEQPSKSSEQPSKSSEQPSKSSEQSSSSSINISLTKSEIEEVIKDDLGLWRQWKNLNSKVPTAEYSVLKGEKSKFERKLLHKIFDENYINVAHLPAVVSDDNSEIEVTFKELYEASNRVARTIFNFLTSKIHIFNQHTDWIVALYMKPSYRAVLCMLSTWKVGAGYLPLNYENPKRIKEILNQAKPQLVIVDNEFMTSESRRFLAEFNVISYKNLSNDAKRQSLEYFPDDKSMMHRKINEDNLAMVLYSSEVFVSPRGTRIHHNACQHRLEWQWAKFPFQYEETHCIAHNAIYHIDQFGEFWGPLLKGKTLVLMKDYNRKNIERIITVMDEYDIMRFYGLPSKIDKILDKAMEKASSNPKAKKPLLNTGLWISSGDVLEKETAIKFFNYYENDGKHILTNSYGCTETTGDCCYFVMKSLEQIQSFQRIPLGIPNLGTYVYILDEDSDPVEKHQSGEIHIVGPLLAGYIDESNITTYKHNRYSLMPTNWNMFNTEDYGAIINGLLYYDGKKKIKVRYDDHDINYLMVEKFIKELEYVENAIVIPTKEKLVAFMILDRLQARINKDKIKDDILKELPEYALPEIVLHYRFPLLQNGEIDKDALIQEYNQANDPNIQGHEKLTIDLEGIPEDKKEMAKRVFTIIGNNIGQALTGTIKPSTNFFNIGGCSLNVVSSIYELYRTGFSISADNFLRAKDFNEILSKIEPAERHSCIREDYGFETNDNWKICTVRYDDLEECLDCLLECYTKKHVLVKLDPKMTAEILRRFIESNWINFVERGLSFKVVDKETDKTISVALNIELEEESYMKFEGFEEFEPLLEFQKFMEENYAKENYRKNAYITNYFMGTSMDVSPAENVSLIYHMENHLIKLMQDSHFSGVYSNGVCPLNEQICELILGYRTIEKYAANRFVNKNNERPFKDTHDNIVQYLQVYEPKKR